MDQVSLEKVDHYTLRGVPAPYVGLLWTQVSEFLHEMPTEDYTLSDIFNLILDRKIQLWTVYRGVEMVAVFTTEIVIFPRSKVLNVLMAVGSEINGWFHLFRDVVIPWGVSQGCSAIEIQGRPGWEKLIDRTFPKGWAQKRSVVMRGQINGKE